MKVGKRIEGFTLRIGDIISKKEYNSLGGMKNPRCARITRNKSWVYIYLQR